MRCFVGLTVAESTRAALVQLQDEIAAWGLPERELRLVARENFHATLKFLGSVDQAQLPLLKSGLESVACAFQSRLVTLSGLDAFPDRAKPHALFAAVDVGRAWVVQLMEAIDTTCATLGFPPEARPRVPHVTLARLEGRWRRPELAALIERGQPTALGPIDTSALVLFESQSSRQGSRYVPLARLPLA